FPARRSSDLAATLFDVLEHGVGVELAGEEALGCADLLAVLAVDCLGIVADDGELVVEVAGAALNQDVGAVEATGGRAGFLGAAQMPLAHGIGVVATVPQDLGQGGHALVEVAFVAR